MKRAALLILLTTCAQQLVFAQETAATAATAAQPATGGGMNSAQVVLMVLIIMLFLVIMALASVVLQLTRVYFNKGEKPAVNKTGVKAGVITIGIMLLAGQAMGQEAAAAAATDSAAVAPAAKSFFATSLAGVAGVNFYAFMYIVALEVLVIFVLLFLIRVLIKLINYNPEMVPHMEVVLKKSWFERFNRSVSIKNEKAIMISHDYDGIHELDNDLPPWWKWGFVATIVVSIMYIAYYHFLGGPLQTQEYEESVVKARKEVAAYLAKTAGNIDENTVTLITAEGELAEGKTIFANNCAPCHAPDGGGSVGPNLTDDYWLHGGSLKDIFKTIKYGVPEKGMKSWKADFSPKQIAELASYIHNLHGTHPAAPKEKQGELYVESADSKAADTAGAGGGAVTGKAPADTVISAR